MITKIVLRNFKRFKEETFELDSHVIFAGHNNLGKTTVIQAIAAWRFALNEWNKSKNKERAIRLNKNEFAAVPLWGFNQLWTGKSTGMKKDEAEGMHQGAPRPLEIEVYGENKGKKWDLTMEFKYANKDQIFVKPKNAQNVSDAAINLEATHIPSFSGVMINEPEQNRALQDVRIGEGKPGDILRNLLLEVSEKKDDWAKLCKHIKDIFNYELANPSPRGAAYILCECRSLSLQSERGPLLDINTTGSGFQQILLIFAFLYARPSSVILLDEPDAHLHINLQSEIYFILKEIAKDRGAQLIIATHSEVLIDSTDPKNIISFFGEHPCRLSDTHDRWKLQQAMKRLSSLDLLKVEQSEGKLLWLEGESDFYILRAWAHVLKHPAHKLFDDRNAYCNMKRKNPGGAQEHFKALQAVSPIMLGFVLVDSDNESDKEDKFDHNVQGIILKKWKRYEIENYLVHPDALKRFFQLDLSAHWDKGIEKLQGIMPPAYFKDPLNDDSGYLEKVKGSEKILPAVFEAAKFNIGKNEYYRIAEVMKPEEIHSDVKEMLDAIAAHFGIL